MSTPRLMPRHSYTFVTSTGGRVIFTAGGRYPEPTSRFNFVCKRSSDRSVVASVAGNFRDPQRQYILDYWQRYYPAQLR